MASVMPGLLPDSSGVQFTARPALRTRDGPRSITSRSGRSSSIGYADGNALTPNANLSSIEIEAMLREKVRAKADSIKQAFQSYDVDQTMSVTKGEFRRVLESFCTPLSTDQFEAVLAKVNKNPNGTVRYQDFFDKFYGHQPTSSAPAGRRSVNGLPNMIPPPTPKEINVDFIEKLLKEKVEGNLKSVVKALQLFDYNRDGRIQRHEMRRVIENYCFKLSDAQYDKLWQRYDFHHTGLVNYKDFLSRLGVTTNRGKSQEGAVGALNWQNQKPNQHLRSYKQRAEDEELLKTMSFREIEIEFRIRMRDNYPVLKRAFMTFDRGLDGFIDIDDLRSILSQFTLPMSKQLFSQLMEKCGVRGTGKISWENFLEKFQDPVTVGNGQTIPIRPNHKYNPIREGITTVEADDIWKLLYKHVQSNYASIKHAFLQMDVNRRGWVSRSELRDLLKKFQIRLEEDHFKQLMYRIDPHHSNRISYHKFLELFEERDTAEGHKWLNSCHRVNEDNKPAILAWETIEEILKEKITEYWKNVSSALLDYDFKGDGHCSHKNLKKVIDNYVLPVSDEHFKSMVGRCEDATDSQVNYVEFLEKLKVDVRPGDLKGLSTQIFDGSNEREMKRQEDLMCRNNKINGMAHERTSEMTAEEVITRLKDRMAQHSQQFRHAFLAYDRRGKGLVAKRDLREVLASFGMLMSDDQFNVFVSKLNFNGKGHMRYTDFVTNFYDIRAGGGPGEDIQRSGNHHVNPIRGDEFGMSMEEVEKKLASKLRENFANLRAAFYKFDENHTGYLNKDSFRRLLDSCMCVMSDEQFEEFCNKHGISRKTRISYPDFLDKFEVRDTVDGHKWLKSVHRFNELLPTPELSAEDAFDLIKRKAHQQFKDLSQAFIKICGKNSGILKRRDLRQLLQTFVMPLDELEFIKLWKKFDNTGRGFVTFEAFLEKIGAGEFTPGDLMGTSTKILDHSKQFLSDHSEEQQAKHERITAIQANRAGFMTVEAVEQALKDKIRDNYEDFYSAFRKYDTSKKGVLSVREVQKVLIDLNLFLDDEQFFTLLDRCGLATSNSKLNYKQFLQAFEEGRKSSYGPRKGPDVTINEQPDLTNQEAEHKLREMVASQVEILERAFGAFDKDNTSRISVADFRRVLDLFCFKMTDAQWKFLAFGAFDKDNSSRISVADFRRVLDLFCFKMTDAQWKFLAPKLHTSTGGGGDKVNYCLFLDNYTMTEQEDSERWLASLQKSIRSQTPHLMPIDEVEERLGESVQARPNNLAQAFAEADYANLGVVSKEDFQSVLNKNLFRMSDEQFEKVWKIVPVNEFGNVNYREFIKKFNSGGGGDGPTTRLPPPTPLLQRSATTLQKPQLSHRPDSMALRRSTTRLDMSRNGSSRNQSRMMTPLVNAESAESVLKATIYRNWKQIQQQCRQRDASNSGTINVVDLKEILVHYGIDLTSQEFLDLMTKYDMRENGTFCYTDFLRHFILNLKQQDEPTSLLARRRLPTPKVARSAGSTSSQFFEAMMRLRETVTTNWKEMRRVFRSVDPSGMGSCDSQEFRHVLRQFNVNLDEEEFYHLMTYYDKNMDGQLNYNDFIKAYLQRS